MNQVATAMPDIVTADEWAKAREELLIAEKATTRELDALAARRRRLPMVEFANGYVFATPDGPRTLLDLFDGRTQLALYQFMDRGPDEFCQGCTAFAASVPADGPRRLALRDVTWVMASDMPLAQIEAYRERMGWTATFVSSHGSTFTRDCGVGEGFLLSVFLRHGERVFRTYTTTSRGVDRILWVHNILDLTPYGRQQPWEDSPAGWPQAF